MSVGTASVRDFYDGYIDKLKTVNSRHRWVFNSIDKYIPRSSKVLDIGCGTGITSKHLAYGGREVTAVDISPVLIEYAKKYNSHFDSIRYYVSDIVEFDTDEKFDAITMVDVLEHIIPESLPNLFNSIHRFSKEDTKIYLNIPSCDVLRFLNIHKPDTRQIVDNPIETGDIIRMFSDIGFVPIYYHLYWQHYVEFLFITSTQYDKIFRKAFIGNH